MNIKLDIIKSAITKAIKGAGNNSMLPLTSLLSLKYSNNKLALTTYDGRNMFVVKVDIPDAVSDSDFYTIVNAITFCKLIEKLSSEYIELENNLNCLLVKTSNSSYKLDIAVNDDGDLIQFNTIPDELENSKAEEIDLIGLQQAIKTAQASVYKDSGVTVLNGYYLGESFAGSNQQLVCKINNQFTAEPTLISYSTAELLLLMSLKDNEKLILKKLNNSLLFETNQYIIYSSELDNKEVYTNSVIPAVNNLTSLNYSSTITLNKNEFINALDRVNLFVSSRDNNTLKLNFSKDGLILSNLQSTANEKLNISSESDINDFECNVNYNLLKQQMKSLASDSVNLQYGSQKSIQLNEGNATLVIALLN